MKRTLLLILCLDFSNAERSPRAEDPESGYWYDENGMHLIPLDNSDYEFFIET